MLEIEALEHLTMGKQMAVIWLNCYWYIAILGTICLCWLMLKWIARNRTIWWFNYVYLQNVLTNHVFDIKAKRGLGIK